MLAVLVLVLVSLEARGEVLGVLDAMLPPLLLDNMEELVRAASAACELVPLEQLDLGAGSEELEVVEWVRGRGARRVRAVEVRGERGGPLALYVGGWRSAPGDEAARALVAALLQHHPAVLVVDTSRAFRRPYVAAAAQVAPLARALAALLERLHGVGVPPGELHLVGFSLGAHVAGLAGRLAARRLGARLGRITALDPARPCFTRSPYRLRREDATFVQAVHSSAGVLGLARPLAHADVYVTGVRARQPECAGETGAAALDCDHNAAWRVFALWARGGGGLRARRCTAWREVQRGVCAGSPTVLPHPCVTSAHGMFLYKPTFTWGADQGHPRHVPLRTHLHLKS